MLFCFLYLTYIKRNLYIVACTMKQVLLFISVFFFMIVKAIIALISKRKNLLSPSRLQKNTLDLITYRDIFIRLPLTRLTFSFPKIVHNQKLVLPAFFALNRKAGRRKVQFQLEMNIIWTFSSAQAHFQDSQVVRLLRN